MGGISKKTRQSKIREAVIRSQVRSQRSLSGILERDGIHVTQSTLSRDILALGLVKVRGVYRVPEEAQSSPRTDIRRSLRELVINSGVSGNILIMKTAPGDGHALGVVLDAAGWPEILGTVAGDDTVFALLRSSRIGKQVLRRIEGLRL
jgi:transcriptional regulator of arginine metabolism